MSAFNWSQSVQQGQRRLAKRTRAPRSDQEKSRFPQRVEAELQRLLAGPERPALAALARSLRATCERWGEPVPSRATVYNAIARARSQRYAVAQLPQAVQRTLLNLDASELAGEQVVFFAFNYGTAEAISFASGLPWLCLLRAEQLPGFRPKSRALLRAVMHYRGIR